MVEANQHGASDAAASAPPHRAAIALGSNLGNSLVTLRGALQALDDHPAIAVRYTSQLYQTAAVGPPQPDYLNACVVVETSLRAVDLLRSLLAIEQRFGRQRRERWGPRTLDLDLLLFDDVVIDVPELQVPHPRLAERAFVLVPLAEIAPDWVEPVSGKAIATLLATLGDGAERDGAETDPCCATEAALDR
ncbi:MAG: 2-amino-4-hydroxy-6-hydroxymethyldihydropteridine diphosphokinase [Elainellaceae cyanobacterium]